MGLGENIGGLRDLALGGGAVRIYQMFSSIFSNDRRPLPEIVRHPVLDYSIDPSDILYTHAQGRMFDDCMTSGRSHGYSNEDLIENPAYIIESLIRHEILSEIDLVCSDNSSSGGYNLFSFDGDSGFLISDNNDYYNGAYLLNLTQDWVALVEDYVGSTKTIYVDNSYTGYDTDKYKIFNIHGDTLIDTTSFDNIGNTFDGKRKNWEMALSLTEVENFEDIISLLLNESFLILVKSWNKYKLIPLLGSKTTVDGTFNKPLYSNGVPMINCDFVPIENLYTNFTIEYFYDYGKNDNIYKYIINSGGWSKTTPSTISYNFDDEVEKINNVIDNYKIDKKLVYSSKHFRNDNTAALFTKKIIDLYTKQRLIVTYTGDIKNHIQYEIGDVVKIDYDRMIPASLNNSAQFQIQSKSIDMTKRNGSVTFSLLEV